MFWKGVILNFAKKFLLPDTLESSYSFKEKENLILLFDKVVIGNDLTIILYHSYSSILFLFQIRLLSF